MLGGLVGLFAGEFAQPSVNGRLFLGVHLPKRDAHAENTKTADGMQVENLAGQFAGLIPVTDAEAQFRAGGNRFQRSDVAATRTQLGELREDARSVTKCNFTIREKREARINAPNLEGIVSHGGTSVRTC